MCRISRSQFQQDMSQFHNNRMSQFQGFTFTDDDLDEFLEEKSREGGQRIAKENNHLDEDLFHVS